MQAFRTQLKNPEYPFKLSYSDTLLSMGSCFAAQIAQRLQGLKFDVLDNPFGILYHPLAMANALQRILSGKPYDSSELFEWDGLWSHFDFHSAFSQPEKEHCLQKMNKSVSLARSRLGEASLLVLTLGTAYAWWHQREDRFVANCHKLPRQQFERRLMEVDQMADSLVAIIKALRSFNPGLRCLITVSPIRHLRDGLVENQLSKASLRLTAHHLCDRLPDVYYFPSYELMMDDLRDYRFYTRDMIHPTSEALDYIWSYFQGAFFEPPTQALMAKIEKIRQGLSHRPRFPDSPAHQRFKRQLVAQMEAIEQKYGFISFLSEKEKLLS